MNTVEQRFSRENHDVAYAAPVPAARSLNEFCTERVSDDVVLFDTALDRYHTLNSLAFDIWRLCDGTRSIHEIEIALDRKTTSTEAVAAAVAQLGESGLLQASEDDFDAAMHRRRLLKLAAAGAIGAVGIPVVASITRPSPAAAASCPGEPCGPVGSPACCPGYTCISFGGNAKCVECAGAGQSCTPGQTYCCYNGTPCPTSMTCP